MKKADIVNLIKYHYEKKEASFRKQVNVIANDFHNAGDEQLAAYVMGFLYENGRLVPQDTLGNEYLSVLPVAQGSLPLPEVILNDLQGIIHAVGHHIGVNKFIFVGPPGTGKTESAKQLAKLLNRELLNVNMSELIDSKLGETSKNITKLFKEINTLPYPEEYVILFDEIDIIALDRINQRDVREMGRVTSTFLKALDIVNKDVVIIATTNLQDNLDKALLRRFDASINFDAYTDEDLVDVGEILINDMLKQFKSVTKDKKLYKKILRTAPYLPYPGDLKNIIRRSFAFSDPKVPEDYLRRLIKAVHEGKMPTLQQLAKLGFTVREIEVLTGKSKSSVARELQDESQGESL